MSNKSATITGTLGVDISEQSMSNPLRIEGDVKVVNEIVNVSTPKARYEYKVISIESTVLQDLEKRLCDLGNQGWQLVYVQQSHITNNTQGGTSHGSLIGGIFMREIKK